MLTWVIARGACCFVVLNRFPYASGHVMVLPQRHIAAYTDLTAAELVEITALSQHAARVLERVMAPDGFNIGMNLGRAAGAGIDKHLHLHVVPRWSGDFNFMPVLADGNVVPRRRRQPADGETRPGGAKR